MLIIAERVDSNPPSASILIKSGSIVVSDVTDVVDVTNVSVVVSKIVVWSSSMS